MKEIFVAFFLCTAQLIASDDHNWDGGPDCGGSNECNRGFDRPDGPHSGGCHDSVVGSPGCNGMAIMVDFEPGANGPCGPEEFVSR